MSNERIIHMQVDWSTSHTIEVPDDYTGDLDELAQAINGGEIPEWVSEEIDARCAEMVDWTATS